ncbi:MAG: TATA-box-binding protein [Candidatus Bathyarchaeota archaeon]
MAETLDFEIEIQNVVASVTLDQKFSLPDILKNFRTAEYNSKRFPGLIYRLKRPKTTTLIFSSGKMVCTGAKSEKLAKMAVNKVVRELKKGGIIILGKPKIVIQNIVATANLQSRIDLETAADVLDNVMYEPGQFPGLIYRMGEPKTVLLAFASGKIVCTGGKNEKISPRIRTQTTRTTRRQRLILQVNWLLSKPWLVIDVYAVICEGIVSGCNKIAAYRYLHA